MCTDSINNGLRPQYRLTIARTLIMIRDKCANEDSITYMSAENNNQMFKNESEKCCQVLLKPAAILFTQIGQMMSTGSHQCILARNMTGLSRATSVAHASKTPSCSGTPSA